VAAIKRATKEGNVYCEECGALAKSFEVDHVRADGLLGSNLLDNARVLCRLCHVAKTRDDVARIAKAKRVEARALGVRKKPTLKSRGFEKVEKVRTIDKDALPPLPRRKLFDD
jgi:5-methylcytosine-specific restriction endonuclease McrA